MSERSRRDIPGNKRKINKKVKNKNEGKKDDPRLAEAKAARNGTRLPDLMQRPLESRSRVCQLHTGAQREGQGGEAARAECPRV